MDPKVGSLLPMKVAPVRRTSRSGEHRINPVDPFLGPIGPVRRTGVSSSRRIVSAPPAAPADRERQTDCTSRTSGRKWRSRFWMPCLRVAVEDGQPEQAPFMAR